MVRSTSFDCQPRLEEKTDEEPVALAVTVLAHGFDELGCLGGVG